MFDKVGNKDKETTGILWVVIKFTKTSNRDMTWQTKTGIQIPMHYPHYPDIVNYVVFGLTLKFHKLMNSFQSLGVNFNL